MARSKAPKTTEITLLRALIDEHRGIGGAFPRGEPQTLAALWSEIHRQHKAREKSRVALCLSGGGIRSATFGLGVLQGLASRKLLGTFDYLSTVSGGGYVGGWLSAWIHRHEGKLGAVEAALAGAAPPDPGRAADLNPKEPLPVRRLREYSNYLTPRLGIFSADTWTLVGTYLRNLLLNWFALLPLLAAFLMLPRLLHAVIGAPRGGIAPWVALGGIALLAVSVVTMTWWRPTVYKHREHRWATRESRFLAVALLPLLAGSLLTVVGWAWLEATPGRGHNAVQRVVNVIGWGGIIGLFPVPLEGWIRGWLNPLAAKLTAFGAFAQLCAWIVYAVLVRSKGWWWEAFSSAIAGGLAGLGAWGLVRASGVLPDTVRWPLYTTLAAPALLGVLLVSTTVFIGLMSRWTDDEDREWWARYGGWILVSATGWIVIAALVLFGPPLFAEGWKKAAAVWGLSGVWSLVVGWSGSTAANEKAVRERQGLKEKLIGYALDHVTILAAVVFLVALVTALSWATTLVLAVVAGLSAQDHPGVLAAARPRHVLGTGLALLGIALAVGAFLHVNKFSLHAMYRSRLIRAYLGASHVGRTPHPVTGFDPDDDVVMASLAPEGKPQRPVHVVNMALNLVGGTDLAWQERKAASFTVTPLHAGSSDPRLGYRPAAEYGKGFHDPITLGTAMTISGAAVSPNQGYNSSPPVTLVLALFNVRLGWWLGNPGPAGEEKFRRAGPRLYFGPMVSEMLGWTDRSHEYVYLSDGGHFENLGLYEMVLRRCHYVLVSDAGCDPESALEDLGNAIRKVRTDLGISIELDQAAFKIAARGVPNPGGRYCAVGAIHYRDTDGPDADDGTLVYLKPGFYGDEPKDIFNYATAHPTFPHESTSDQWFSESQFESYRALGRHAVERMCAEPPGPIADFPALLERVHAYVGAASKR